MFTLPNKKIFYYRTIYISCTSILGFCRGTQDYKYTYNKKMDRYLKEKKCYEKPQFFYYNYFCYGFLGSLLYVNPFTLPWMIPKELYRLEVDLRKLEDEKKTSYYNEIY